MDFIYVGIILIVGTVTFINSYQKNKYKNECKKKNKEIKNINANNVILRDWIYLKQSGVNLSDWLYQNNIQNIAIYGYGVLGKVLFTELKSSNVNVVCVADKNNRNIFLDVPVVGIDEIPQVDAIIISVINYYDEIESELVKFYKYAIISLEDIVYGVGVKFDE